MSALDTKGMTHVSARWRIVGWIVLTTALALLAVTVTMRSVLLGQVTESANAHIVQETEEFRTYAIDGIDPKTGNPFTSTSALIADYLAMQTPSTGEAIIGVIGDQVLFTDNTQGDAGELLANDRTRLDVILNDPSSSGTAMTDHGELRWGKVIAQANTPDQPPGFVIVAHFTSLDQERVDQEAVLLFAVAIGGLALTAGIAWLIAGRILRPLRDMLKAAEAITTHDLSARLPVSGQDDIADLAVTLNSLLQRVELAYTSQHHFVSEARQHLTAPINRSTEAIAPLLAATDPSQRAVANYVTQQLGLMSGTLADLDTLAQIGNPNFVRPASCLVKEITVDAYTYAVAAYPQHRIRLEATGSGQGWLDAARIGEALREIIDNAATHCPPGEPIGIGSLVDGNSMRLWVTNHGPQLSQTEAEAMLMAYRTDVEGGMGLGMAVVKAVADAHGGSVWLESDAERTQIGLELPLDKLAPTPDEEDES